MTQRPLSVNLAKIPIQNLGGHFCPEKKYLAPSPPIPQFAADTLPAPRPLPLLDTPAPPGIFNKKVNPTPALGASPPPSPSLAEKKNKSETPTKKQQRNLKSATAKFTVVPKMGMRQRSGEGVVRRNGRPKRCLWRVRFSLCPLKVFRTFQVFSKANLKGLSKNTLLDDRFSARRLRRSFGALWKNPQYFWVCR